MKTRSKNKKLRGRVPRNKLIYIIIILGVLLSLCFVYAKIGLDTDKDGLADLEEQNVYFTNINNADTDNDTVSDGQEVFTGNSPTDANDVGIDKITLAVPYVNESPDGNWTGPWKNACEEASITMVENYYLGVKDVGIKQAMDYMNMLFDKQNKIWGSNSDSDAYRTAKLINDFTDYNARIQDNPTVDAIKTEIQQKRPVISLHYGKDLQNKNIPFLATGSYYHMMVIIGYDDTTKEFITNDTGDIKTGAKHRYGYDLFINSLHDFSFTTRKADGPARVLFTFPKLAKTTSDSKVYYLHGNTRQWITSEAAFISNNFDWNAINIVRQEWLDTFADGADITIK